MDVLDLRGHELVFPRSTQRFEIMRPDFEAWLLARGATLLPPHIWEVLRYKYKGYTNIIYHKATGQLTYVGGVGYDMKEFVKGDVLPYKEQSSPPVWVKPDRPVKIRPNKPSRHSINKTKRGTVIFRLIERDGSTCWFCDKPLGDDITKEHLHPRSKGGTSALENLVLAHKSCNQMAGHMPVEMKYALRKHLREQHLTTSKPEESPC